MRICAFIYYGLLLFFNFHALTSPWFQVIRTHFPNRTIITIAHRLDTVVDNDKIVVMNAGSVAEFGPPLELLQREDGMMRQMAVAAGNLDHLIQRAAGDTSHSM